MLRYTVHVFFVVYTLMLFARIALSWFPSCYKYKFTHFIRFYTDPYLKVFQRIIPPIGGVLDLSPLLGFFALRFIERIVLRILP